MIETERLKLEGWRQQKDSMLRKFNSQTWLNDDEELKWQHATWQNDCFASGINYYEHKTDLNFVLVDIMLYSLEGSNCLIVCFFFQWARLKETLVKYSSQKMAFDTVAIWNV